MMISAVSKAAVAASLLLSASPAIAGSVVIWPVDPVIKKGERATAIWVENQGTEPMSVQIRAFGWTQPDGEQALSEQDEVVASPPIATVPAGQRQLIRVIRRTPGAGASESPYRLLIDELPPPPSADKPATPQASLGVQMRYSIPLFAYNVEAATLAPKLETRLVDAAGARYLIVTNTGGRHARLIDLRATDGPPLVSGLVGYVLAGQSLRIPVPKDAPAAPFSVTVNGAEQRLTPVS